MSDLEEKLKNPYIGLMAVTFPNMPTSVTADGVAVADINHENLKNLLGGGENEHYHLSKDDYERLSEFVKEQREEEENGEIWYRLNETEYNGLCELMDSFNLFDEDSDHVIMNEDTVNDLLAEYTEDFVDEAAVNSLIDAKTKDFLDETAVNELIETATHDLVDLSAVNRLIADSTQDFLDETAVNNLIADGTKDFLDEDAIKALIAENSSSGATPTSSARILTENDVNTLIDARNYLDETAVNSLIAAGTQDFVNEDEVKALIADCASSSSSCNCGLKEAEVNALIDARNYVNETTVNTLIETATQNFLDETAIKGLITENAGGLTEDQVNALIDDRLYNIRAFKDTYFNEYVKELALGVVNERVKSTALN